MCLLCEKRTLLERFFGKIQSKVILRSRFLGGRYRFFLDDIRVIQKHVKHMTNFCPHRSPSLKFNNSPLKNGVWKTILSADPGVYSDETCSVGTFKNHHKDSYEAISIMESLLFFLVAHVSMWFMASQPTPPPWLATPHQKWWFNSRPYWRKPL